MRREEIARAALRIVGERGLPDLTAATLADAIGVTSGALFRHFASRADILRAAVTHGVARLAGTFPDATLPPLRRLLALARARIRLLVAEPGLAWLLRSDEAHLALPGDAVDRLRECAEESRAFLLAALRDGQRDGHVRADLPPVVLVVPVLGTIHALVGPPGVHRLAHHRPVDPEPVLAGLARLLAPPGGRLPHGRRSAPRKPSHP